MSHAHCNPSLVESLARTLSETQGTVPEALSRARIAVEALVTELDDEMCQLEAIARASAASEQGGAGGSGMASAIMDARRRLQRVRAVSSRLGDVCRTGDRVDDSCRGLALHLGEVAMYVRDVMRSGMPDPSPRHLSASPADIQSGLRTALDRSPSSATHLPDLPARGPEAPSRAGDAILPTDNSRPTDNLPWWDR